ncbi:unnamed protein product, partial [marine sediment metagenome]
RPKDVCAVVRVKTVKHVWHWNFNLKYHKLKLTKIYV